MGRVGYGPSLFGLSWLWAEFVLGYGQTELPRPIKMLFFYPELGEEFRLGNGRFEPLSMGLFWVFPMVQLEILPLAEGIYLMVLSRSFTDHHLRCGGWLNFEFSKRGNIWDGSLKLFTRSKAESC